MKTDNLSGDALDWAVAKCEAQMADNPNDVSYWEAVFCRWDDFRGSNQYSTNWAFGGPIIEREGIWIRECATVCPAIPPGSPDKKWFAYASRRHAEGDFGCYYGKTYLLAAMRCYVASKLGKEVEIPEELR